MGPREFSPSALTPAPVGSQCLAITLAREVRVNTNYLVRDLMTIDPVVISPNSRIHDALRLLELYDVSGLPVVDDAGRLVGVISQTDLLHITNDEHEAVRWWNTGRRVGDLMTSPAITVEYMTPLPEAARLLKAEKIHRLVAVDASGRAIGVLSSMDFVTLYAEG